MVATLERPNPTKATAANRFITSQVVNSDRHLAALRPFRRDEFGDGPASPSAAHILAANRLLQRLHAPLERLAGQVARQGETSVRAVSPANLQRLLAAKERSGEWVKFVEKIWQYYFELFGQRQSAAANWLMACDRIAQDCYQSIYTGLGKPRSIPSPPPFTLMATGASPSTYRRGVNLSKLGKMANPFPIIELPYHRLVNPWTLGAIPHEVSHNIQNDLGLWEVVPKRLQAALGEAGISAQAARIWARCHKEIWADLCGLLLGGPAVVDSLMDVLARSRRATLAFNPAGVHPTPYLRLLINLELLRRMGFPGHAGAIERFWQRLYPAPQRSNLPPALLKSFPRCSELVVDTICFQPYSELGGKSLAQVSAFRPVHEPMVAEAADRLAAGVDPGILPARFLIGAARGAIDGRLAPPEKVAKNFYGALVDR